MPIELSILTFIVLIVLPFVFLIISLRPTQEGYEYVKISMMVLTAILFFIAAYAFISTGGISIAIMDNALEKKNLLAPGSLAGSADVNNGNDGGQFRYFSLCDLYFGSGSNSTYTYYTGCADPPAFLNFQGHAGTNKKIVLFAVDGQYDKEVYINLDIDFVRSVYIKLKAGIVGYIPFNEGHSYYYKESNPIVGSAFDMQVLASIYLMIGLISSVFAVGEVFRIPAKRL